MKRTLILVLLVVLALTACTSQTETLLPTATENAQTVPQAPTATPTEAPVAVLNICMTGLPESAFPYDGKNPTAKQNLLALIQQTDLLADMPTQENRGIALQPVNVSLGEKVVDAKGDLVTLKQGVTVRPSGCRTADCAVAWDGTAPLTMDQMVVAFQLNPGFTWSDGAALTAADSVFSFKLASDSDAPGLQWMESRTASYSAESELGIVWKGLPGFTISAIEELFWQPLPSHLFTNDSSWASIATDPSWSATMPSLGLYRVENWTEDSIQLVQNMNLGNAQVQYGVINLKAIPELDAAAAAFSAGTCDALDQSYHLERDAEMVGTLQADSNATVVAEQTDSWLQLAFGIKPASYDEYYNPLYGDRADFFGDSRTREAIASCLDREAIQEAVYTGLAELWPSFVSMDKTTLSDEERIIRDVAKASQLLEAVGWRDHDLNPETPLQAWYVYGIPANTDFSVTLYVDSSSFSQQIAAIIQGSLGECGIEVTPVTIPASQLYAAGPEGVLFGRQFDLALIGWASMTEADCTLYNSDQVPSQGNRWVGTNIAGWSEAAYDATCNQVTLALPDEKDAALNLAETVFLEGLPAVPLFSVPETLAINSSACVAVVELLGLDIDPTTCP